MTHWLPSVGLVFALLFAAFWWLARRAESRDRFRVAMYCRGAAAGCAMVLAAKDSLCLFAGMTPTRLFALVACTWAVVAIKFIGDALDCRAAGKPS